MTCFCFRPVLKTSIFPRREPIPDTSLVVVAVVDVVVVVVVATCGYSRKALAREVESNHRKTREKLADPDSRTQLLLLLLLLLILPSVVQVSCRENPFLIKILLGKELPLKSNKVDSPGCTETPSNGRRLRTSVFSSCTFKNSKCKCAGPKKSIVAVSLCSYEAENPRDSREIRVYPSRSSIVIEAHAFPEQIGASCSTAIASTSSWASNTCHFGAVAFQSTPAESFRIFRMPVSKLGEVEREPLPVVAFGSLLCGCEF